MRIACISPKQKPLPRTTLTALILSAIVIAGIFTVFAQFNCDSVPEIFLTHSAESGFTYYEWDDAGKRQELQAEYGQSGFLAKVSGSDFIDTALAAASAEGAGNAGDEESAEDAASAGEEPPRHRLGYSRPLSETVEYALLTLSNMGDIPYVIFLDEAIIYTDYPGEAGSPDMPPAGLDSIARQYDPGLPRSVSISLPPDYVGKTLTVVEYLTAGQAAYWNPMPVSIATSEAEGISAVLNYGPKGVMGGMIAAVLLIFTALFIRQLFAGRKPYLLLLPIFYTLIYMIKTAAYSRFDTKSLLNQVLGFVFAVAFYCAGDLLLLFLAFKMKRAVHRRALLVTASLHFLITAACLLRQQLVGEFLIINGAWLGILGFCVLLLASLLLIVESRYNRYFRYGSYCLLSACAGYALFVLVFRFTNYALFAELSAPVSSVWPMLHFYPLNQLLSLFMLLTVLLLSVSEAVSELTERQARIAALEQLNRLKTDYLASVAHEIKTPLTVLMGSARDSLDLLAETPVNTREIAEDQLLIERTVKSIDNIIIDLMDTAAIENGRLTLKRRPVFLANLLQNICESFFARTDCRGNRLLCELQPELQEVWADSSRIEQVIINLLSNAVKHTVDGTISVQLTGRGTLQTVSVKDSGEGMDALMQGTAFNLYASTGENRWRHGIGLYLCRQIIEAHGGDIWLESEKGQGTCVSFTLRQEKGLVDDE
jgi:signal transduction histidine kinase